MSTNFPTALDTFPNGPTLATHTLGTDPHSSLHGNLGDSVAALETKVGVNGSTDTNSLDYKINHVTSSSGANPTASIGLTAVNGVATTFIRSDAAPPLDQTIAPTWTSLHTFNTAPTSPDGQANCEVWGKSSTVTGTYSVVVGAGSTAAANAVSVGAGSTAASGAVALGRAANAAGAFSIAIGQSSTANQYASLNIGYQSSVASGGSGSHSLGNNNSVSGVNYSLAIGGQHTIAKQAAILIGTAITATRDFEFAIGVASNVLATSGYRIRVGGNFNGQTTTYDVGIIDFPWYNSTLSTRQGQINLIPVDYNASRVALSVAANGTAPILSFYGGTMVAQPAQYALVGTATRTMPTDNCAGGAATMAQVQAQVSALQGIVYQLLKDLGPVSGNSLLNTNL